MAQTQRPILAATDLTPSGDEAVRQAIVSRGGTAVR